MIIKAKTRGDAVALGRYLLSSKNEQIEIHSVDGFFADDVLGAMRETEAQASAVKSRQYLFSMSLSPPPNEEVGMEVYDKAILNVKERMGLSGQPHIALFHENGGRRHMHLVISRIDPETLTVKPVDHYKYKLRDLSKSIFVERGWDMPRGLIDKENRDPRQFTMAEWQQARRIGRDSAHLKMLAQEAWAMSDNPASFEKAMESRGLYLARGDRRSHVAMTWQGEVFALARLLNRRTKEVRERLGSSDTMRDLETTRQHVRDTVEPMLQRLAGQADQQKAQALSSFDQRRMAMTQGHSAERKRLDAGIEARRLSEQKTRTERLRTGIMGLWDRMTGKHSRVHRQNEFEALMAMRRDREQRDALVLAQLRERRTLQVEIAEVQKRHEARLDALHRDLAAQREQPQPQVQPQQVYRQRQTETAREPFRQAVMPSRDERMTQREERRNRQRDRSRERSRDFGYGME
ncbi:hypothetical protein J3E64_001542 [Sphingobium sp. OAS761]|uniref:relaxase/mobilization nuclease domain-containing protein n=1 Tax=Sphingobium sp. OAS761 TaxID=2817901 RepID=UPI0020A0BBFE|nr:relaxase/mobilization nuclease domain-containing protein [Sphingobium sp. OAS761]MCP1469860.1 hypothetical protein [Sphingobium sp. OAS761]